MVIMNEHNKCVDEKNDFIQGKVNRKKVLRS